VVATEVRKLAERSQTAAKEISALATDSVGVAERSGKLLDELVPSIKEDGGPGQEVSSASREQSSGVSQINKAMSQVDLVTQPQRRFRGRALEHSGRTPLLRLKLSCNSWTSQDQRR